jgi:hypothetical protein
MILRGRGIPVREIDSIWLHCSATRYGCASVFRAWHQARNWNDIGYHGVVLNGTPWDDGQEWSMLDGQIELGRPFNTMGAHVSGSNRRSVGLCLVGLDYFTAKQLAAMKRWVTDVGLKYGIEVPARVFGHYESPSTKKTCPNMPMDRVRDFLVDKISDVELMAAIAAYNGK